LVRDLTGRTFPALLREARLAHAVRLLQAGDEPIRSVAVVSGFRDPGYFTRVFRQTYGMTPQAFRTRQQSGEGS